MRAYPLALLGLSLLAGTAGYISHQLMAPAPSTSPQVLAAETPDVVANGGQAGGQSNADPMTWQLATPDGASAALADQQGTILVVNFWATWCPPCLREIPAFIDLQRRYGANGAQFVGIALDKAEAVKPFVADKGINYPVLIGDQQVVQMMQLFGNEIGALPYTVVLRDGLAVYTHQGEWHAEDAENRIKALLEAETR